MLALILSLATETASNKKPVNKILAPIVIPKPVSIYGQIWSNDGVLVHSFIASKLITISDTIFYIDVITGETFKLNKGYVIIFTPNPDTTKPKFFDKVSK